MAESNVGSGTSSPWGSDFERPGNREEGRHAGQREENNEYDEIALGDIGGEENSVSNEAEGEVKESADEERGDKAGEEPVSKSEDWVYWTIYLLDPLKYYDLLGTIDELVIQKLAIRLRR